MGFRIATLNLGLNQKCWESRRELIATQLKDLDPDTLCLNEIHLPAAARRKTKRHRLRLAAAVQGRRGLAQGG